MLLRPSFYRDLLGILKTVFYLIFTTSQFISAVITIFGTSLGVAIIAWLVNRSRIALYAGTFSAGILIALLFVGISYWRSFPQTWLVRGYRWVHAEYVYQIHEDDIKHHSQLITILLEAVRPGVDHFENRYFWTGLGTEKEPEVQSVGHKMMGTTLPRAGWRFYYVHLGRDLNVGEKTEVKIFQDLYDEKGKFEPFLAKTVIEPLDDLTLRVILPKNQHPSQILNVESHCDAPTYTRIRQSAGEYDLQNSEIKWKIPHPVLGHRYAVHWS